MALSTTRVLLFLLACFASLGTLHAQSEEDNYDFNSNENSEIYDSKMSEYYLDSIRKDHIDSIEYSKVEKDQKDSQYKVYDIKLQFTDYKSIDEGIVLAKYLGLYALFKADGINPSDAFKEITDINSICLSIHKSRLNEGQLPYKFVYTSSYSMEAVDFIKWKLSGSSTKENYEMEIKAPLSQPKDFISLKNRLDSSEIQYTIGYASFQEVFVKINFSSKTYNEILSILNKNSLDIATLGTTPILVLM